jgi:hypothetical protein
MKADTLRWGSASLVCLACTPAPRTAPVTPPPTHVAALAPRPSAEEGEKRPHSMEVDGVQIEEVEIPGAGASSADPELGRRLKALKESGALEPLDAEAVSDTSDRIRQDARAAGYELTNRGLLRAGKVIVTGASRLGWFGTSERGDPAAIVCRDPRPGEATSQYSFAVCWLVRGARSERWDHICLEECGPMWIGADLLHLVLHRPTPLADPQSVIVEVLRNDRKEHELSLPVAIGPPVKRFAAYDGAWVLETTFDDVLVNGVSVTRDGQADAAFGWHVAKGRPSYFFKKGDSYGLQFGGRVLPMAYDDIPHGGCCEHAAFNPFLSEKVTRFVARRASRWYVVTLR